MAANGIREEYLFPNASVYVRQAAHLAGIQTKNDLVLYTLFCDIKM